MNRLTTLTKTFTQNSIANFDTFAHVKLAPPDPILGTAIAYKNDTNEKKMNLGIGAYRDDNEKPYPFKIVRQVDLELAKDEKQDKEYLGIDGLQSFVTAARKLVFGAESPLVKDGKIASAQTISGTGALRVAYEFIAAHAPAECYVPNPTWGNHNTIIEKSGLKCSFYKYYNAKTMGFDLEGMLSDLSNMKPGSVVLLHACAHNPTGVDPTIDQWRKIAAVVKEKQLFPLFDSAYQGFASGDLIKDAASIRLFIDMGIQMILTQSFAKNMGLYGERVGAVHIVCNSKDVADKVLSQLKLVIRPMYSNPPMHGALIASKILNDPAYFNSWQAELKEVSKRIIDMRHLLRDELVRLKVPGNWDHIVNQIGMFSYTGLNEKQCGILIDKWHIYLLRNGRISMAGITSKNVKYLANAIADAVNSTK